MKRLACPIQILSQFRDDHPEISLIRFQWQDYSGVVRARVLVLEAVIPLIAEGKPIQAAGIAIDCTVNNIILHRKAPRGMYWALPDWSSLCVASHPGTALVMCALDYEQHNSIRSDLFPRQALTTVLQKANKSWGLNFLVGFEIEFTVMKSSSASDTMVRCSEVYGVLVINTWNNAYISYAPRV
ncbi:glutamine synthetase [Penicillium longicatenatum]|nr:glutamine synthetase [Penicillium longicatenatum]